VRVSDSFPLKPIPFWQSLLIFGIPGGLIYAGVHFLVPRLVAAGMPLIFAWSACVLVPTIANAGVVVSTYIWHKQPTWITFKQRFRLQKLPLRYWWRVPIAAVVILVFNEALAWTIPLLQQFPGFGLPPVVPEIFVDPYAAIAPESGVATFMGVPLQPQNIWLIPFWLVWIVGGVLGEELVWRGYALPRQELTYGQWAWLVNGLLWNVPFHLYTLSNCLADLPFFLILPFLTQRIQNTWLAIAIHAVMVSLAYALIVPGVLP